MFRRGTAFVVSALLALSVTASLYAQRGGGGGGRGGGGGGSSRGGGGGQNYGGGNRGGGGGLQGGNNFYRGGGGNYYGGGRYNGNFGNYYGGGRNYGGFYGGGYGYNPWQYGYGGFGNYGGYGYGYGRGAGSGVFLGGSPYYYGSAGNYYANPAPVIVTGPVMATSAYANNTEPPIAPEAPATAVQLAIIVPEAAAQVWLDETEMQTRGTVREFISPGLDPGKKYSYVVRARWQDGDRVIDQSRQVPVTPGQRAVVDFSKPEMIAPKAAIQ